MSLNELTPTIFHIELTHLDSEASKLILNYFHVLSEYSANIKSYKQMLKHKKIIIFPKMLLKYIN